MNKEKSVSHERANDNEPILNDAQIEQIEQYYKHKFPESTQRPKFEEVARTLSNTESMKDFLECEMDVLLNLVDQNDVSGGVTLADDDHLDGDTFRGGPVTLSQSTHDAMVQSIYEATPVQYAETFPMVPGNFQIGAIEPASIVPVPAMVAHPQLYDSLMNVTPNTGGQLLPGVPMHTEFGWPQTFIPPENPIIHGYSTYGEASETIGVPQNINMQSLYGRQVYYQPTSHPMVQAQSIGHAILPTQNHTFHPLGSELQQPLLRPLPPSSFSPGHLRRRHTTGHAGQSRTLLRRPRRANP